MINITLGFDHSVVNVLLDGTATDSLVNFFIIASNAPHLWDDFLNHLFKRQNGQPTKNRIIQHCHPSAEQRWQYQVILKQIGVLHQALLVFRLLR